MKKCKYFQIHEIVCPHVYKQFGETAWNFVPVWMIETLDQLREHFNAPITVNNYEYKGNLTQRGLRCPFCKLVKEKLDKNKLSMSTHAYFEALDFNVKGWKSDDVFDEIFKHQDKFHYIKRMEDKNYTPTWTHIDVRGDYNNIYVFKP